MSLFCIFTFLVLINNNLDLITRNALRRDFFLFVLEFSHPRSVGSSDLGQMYTNSAFGVVHFVIIYVAFRIVKAIRSSFEFRVTFRK